MDQLLLTAVTDELSRALAGGRVDRVMRDERSNIFLAIHAGQHRSLLLLSPDRALPRLHLVTGKPVPAPIAGGFVLYLKSHLAGSRITSVGLLNDDRIAQIAFSRAEKRYRLIFEVFGPSPNILLLDEKDIVLAVHRPVPAGEGAARPLFPGAIYSPPGRRSPARSESEAGSGQHAVEGQAGEFAPANKRAEEWYARRIEEQGLLAVRRRLSQSLRRALSRTERRVRAIESDLSNAGKADEFQMAGNGLLANLSGIRKGMGSADIVLPDNTHISVPLDTSLSPQQNAERYFKKYKKAKAGRDIISGRLSEAKAEAAGLQQGLDDLSAASRLDGVLAIEQKLRRLISVKSGKNIISQADNIGKNPKIKRYIHNKWEIMVGKSASGNEELTFGIAGEDDLWLHAEGLPGSHVVIRNPGRGEVPQDVVLRAASLAAYHSKGRNAGKVSVTYTRARYVRKPRGAKPGTVTLLHRRSIVAVPRESR